MPRPGSSCPESGRARVRPVSRLLLSFAALFALLLGSAGLVATARAQSDWSITFASGFTKPTGGAFSAEWKRGTPVLLAMAGAMSPKFEMGGEFGFVKFSPSSRRLSVPGVGDSVTHVTLGESDWGLFRLRFRARRFFTSAESKVAPFAMAGLGVYPISFQTEDSTGTLTLTQTGSGASIGGGVDYRAGETVHFGIEAQYHYIRVKQEILGYKAAPIVEVLFAIRWLPGGATP